RCKIGWRVRPFYCFCHLKSGSSPHRGAPFSIIRDTQTKKNEGLAMLPSSWLARWNVLPGAPSAHRFLHELADPCLFSGSQLLQRDGDRPQGAFVEVRAVVESERA